LLSSSPQTTAKGVCLQHTLASQADATAFNLDVKMRAVLQRFPRGLTQPQLEAVLAHILKSAVMSDVRLDYSVFSATLFRWQAASQATEGEAFLDLVDGFWRSSLAGAEAAAQRFENAHVFATSVELAGRPLTVEDARAIEDRRSIFVRAALMSEAALYLQMIGLAPAEYARLLQRQRARRPSRWVMCPAASIAPNVATASRTNRAGAGWGAARRARSSRLTSASPAGACARSARNVASIRAGVRARTRARASLRPAVHVASALASAAVAVGGATAATWPSSSSYGRC
jgi:hypothetical protein